MKPFAAIWGPLLSSYMIHGNLDTVFIAIMQWAKHVLLSNIYARVRVQDGVLRMRKFIITSKNLKKTSGCSMIGVNNTFQEFVSGHSKPFTKDIF